MCIPDCCHPSAVRVGCALFVPERGESSTTILPPTESTGKFRLLLIMGGIFQQHETETLHFPLAMTGAREVGGGRGKLFWSKGFKSTLVIAQRQVKERKDASVFIKFYPAAKLGTSRPLMGRGSDPHRLIGAHFLFGNVPFIDHHHHQMC